MDGSNMTDGKNQGGNNSQPIETLLLQREKVATGEVEGALGSRMSEPQKYEGFDRSRVLHVWTKTESVGKQGFRLGGRKRPCKGVCRESTFNVTNLSS